jgi:hypothetical protein
MRNFPDSLETRPRSGDDRTAFVTNATNSHRLQRVLGEIRHDSEET